MPRVPLFRPAFSHKDVDAIKQVLFSGHITTGPVCMQFETMFANRLRVDYAVAVSSCTAALHLALIAAGIGPGDVVFLPTLAFASDIQVVELQGAVPILVDSEPHSLCICPDKLLDAVKQEELMAWSGAKPRSIRHRAVIVVDYAGQMADYSALVSICRDHEMILIEDAAHALPAYWRANPASEWLMPGAVSDLACFSFYATKPVTTAEGGMVVTNKGSYAEAIKSQRLHGFGPLSDEPVQSAWDREVVQPGYKYNLPDLLAALGVRQMTVLDQSWKARRNIAASYQRLLSDCDGLQLPVELPDRQHAWHLYVVRLKGERLINKRVDIMHELFRRGVETSVHWYPLHLHRHYREVFGRAVGFEVMEAAYPALMSLPLFPSMTEEQWHYCAETLLSVLGQAA